MIEKNNFLKLIMVWKLIIVLKWLYCWVVNFFDKKENLMLEVKNSNKKVFFNKK